MQMVLTLASSMQRLRYVSGSCLANHLRMQREVALFDVDAERVKSRQHAAARFGDGRMFDEKRVPDQVCLLRFGHRPKFFVGDVGLTKRFGDQVMVGEQVVDAPEEKFAERGRAQMGVNVVNRSLFDDLLDFVGERWHGATVGEKAPSSSSMLQRNFKLQAPIVADVGASDF